MNWGSFGEIIFKTGFSPQNLKRSNTYRYKKHETFSEYPLLEYTGEGIESIEITIQLSSYFTDIVKTIEKLKEYAKEGKANPLVVGKLYTGKWVIEKIDRVYEETDPQGTSSKQPLP